MLDLSVGLKKSNNGIDSSDNSPTTDQYEFNTSNSNRK